MRKKLPLPWLDTLRLEKTMPQVQLQGEPDVTLSGTRARYGLPDYPAHDALVDAVAAGELYLARLKRIFGRERVGIVFTNGVLKTLFLPIRVFIVV